MVMINSKSNLYSAIRHSFRECRSGVCLSEGVNVDGENLSNLRFADDFALLNETTKQMEKQSKLRKPESWLKNTQRKDKEHDKPCGQRRHTNRSAKN